jgi:hypothetical protein
MADDPILDAKTVAAMMVAIDKVYGLELPTSFPDGTVLAQLWDQSIEVTKDPEAGVLYLANGTTPFPITVLPGTVLVRVDDAAAGQVGRWPGNGVSQP